MRKIQLLVLALVAMVALSAFASTSAFALTFTAAKFLVNGAGFAGALAVETEGELLFENVLSGGGILCSGKFVGTVEENGTTTVTKVLNLAGTEILEKDPTASGIVCTVEKTCEGTDPEINPVNLPFVANLDLDTEDLKFYLLILRNANGLLPGYAILCLVLGININELCEAAFESFGETFNSATDVEALGAISPLGECGGNLEDGLIEVEFSLTILTGGGTLSVSE
jgi:hypothetical protein